MTKILIVDDNIAMRRLLTRFLEKEGYTIDTAENGKSAIEKIKNYKPQLVLLDYQLPDKNGIEVLESIKQIDESIIVIILTAYGNVQNAVKAMKVGAYDFIEKGSDRERLLLIVERALETLRLKDEVKSLQQKLSGQSKTELQLVGESPQMQKVLKQVELVAQTNMSVYLEGETGTGKDLIAQLIHQKSERKLYPFVAVDCGAIPETLFESEMFGHEKGSFTGAIQQRKGKFELANKGTLFLDELCNLPLKQQTKLLRVIQNRTITRLGGKEMIDVDVRLISSCNKPITELVEHGDFKDDLYFRINEFHISIPPLRERKRDIILLANFFRIESNNELQKDVKGFSASAVNQMMEYGWQGNVRELKNVIKKAVLLCDAKHIKPEHLMFMGSDKAMNRKRTFADKRDKPEDKKYPPKSEQTNTISEAVKDTKRQQIKQALDQTSGNKSQAAKILGISRRQLYREMERYGMD